MSDALRPDDLIAHADALRVLARRLVADDATADDLLQDACLAAIERPPSDEVPLRAWLARVIRNLAARSHRDRARRKRREEAASRSEAVPAAVRVAAQLEAHRQLVAALGRLGDPYRSAVVLRFFDGLSPREISERMGAPAATVSTWVHRGIARLRADLVPGRTHDRDALTALLLPILSFDPRLPAAPPVAAATTSGAVATGVLMSAKQLALASIVILVFVAGLAGVIATSRDTHSVTGDDVASGPDSDAARTRTRTDPAATDAATPVDPGEALPRPVDLDACDRDLDLFGRVRDEAGRGVAGAVVRAESSPWRTLDRSRELDGIDVLCTTRTAEDGTFALRLARGDCVDLVVETEGCATVRAVDCQAGERIDVTLTRGVVVTVVANDESGDPIPAAGVELTTKRGLVRQADTAFEVQATAQTDAAGHARLVGVPAGWAGVRVEHPSSGAVRYETVDVPAGDAHTVTVSFPTGRRITGVVTDARTGHPLSGATVRVSSRTEATAVSVGDDGRFVLDGCIATDLITATGERHLDERRRVGEDDVIDFALAPSCRVVARIVRQDDSAADGARVHITAPYVDGQPSVFASTTTDPDGRLEAWGLRPGATHGLVVEADGAGRSEFEVAAPSAPGDTVDAGELVLSVARRVEGIAVDTAGSPLAGAFVTLETVGPPGAPASTRGRERRRTDDLGRFRFTGVAPGDVTLTLSARDLYDTDPLRLEVPIDADVLDARITSLGDRTLDLLVVDDAGKPIAGLDVDVWTSLSSRRGPTLSTDADGHARIRGMPAADTWVACANIIDSPWVRTLIGPLSPGPDTIEIVVPTAVRIAGVVRTENGEGLTGFRVEARAPGSDTGLAMATTRADGTFELKLPAGIAVDLVVPGDRQKELGNGTFSIERTEWRGRRDGAVAPRAGTSAPVVIVVRPDTTPRDRILAVRVLASNGTPLARASVSIRDGDGRGGSALSDSRGDARLTGLPRSGLVVSVSASGAPLGDVPPPVVRVADDTVQLEVVFVRGVVLRGRVVSEDGAALRGGWVDIHTDDFRSVHARVGSDGRFEAGALPGRAHLLEATVFPEAEPGTPWRGRLEAVVPGEAEIEIVVRRP